MEKFLLSIPDWCDCDDEFRKTIDRLNCVIKEAYQQGYQDAKNEKEEVLL